VALGLAFVMSACLQPWSVSCGDLVCTGGVICVDNLVNAPDLDTLYERLIGGFGGLRAPSARKEQSKCSRAARPIM
jgi:hypothetical protein